MHGKVLKWIFTSLVLYSWVFLWYFIVSSEYLLKLKQHSSEVVLSLLYWHWNWYATRCDDMLTFIWTPVSKVRRECRSLSCVNSSWCFTRVGNLSSVCRTILRVSSVEIPECLPCSYLRMNPYDTLQQRMTSETFCHWPYFSLLQINMCEKTAEKLPEEPESEWQRYSVPVIGFILFWTDMCQVQLPLFLLLRNVVQIQQHSSV